MRPVQFRLASQSGQLYMKISLLTDAPKHNLALMKISAYHKACGDEVLLNMPIIPADYTYASVLFEKNINKFFADEYGGPGYEIQDNTRGISCDGLVNGRRKWEVKKPNERGTPNILEEKFNKMVPDYDLFGLDFSLGYTFRSCLRRCSFCKVHKIETDLKHYSIWDFHDPKFKKICLLNNNTFFDKQWRETFEEIWDAELTVIDENGYDLRLLDDEKATALKKTKWDDKLHFAWDRIEDEKEVVRGLELLKKHKINNTHIYVLIGFDTTEEEDLHRCQKLVDYGHDPYIMPYKRTRMNLDFQRMFNLFMWRKYKTIKEAWKDYKR